MDTELADCKATSGFGINVDWEWDKSEIPKGHTMALIQALATAPEGLVFRVGFPTWLISLTKRGRKALSGHEELEASHLSTLS